MKKSNLNWLRCLTAGVMLFGSVLWFCIILDNLANLASTYPSEQLFSKPTGELLLWWQIIFRFIVLLSIIMLAFGVCVIGMGIIIITEIFILIYFLDNHDMRILFGGFQNIYFIRRIIPKSLKGRPDDEDA